MNGYVNKTILRNAVANSALPKELLTASKKGFSVPLRDWFKEDDLNFKVREILLGENDGALYRSEGVAKLLDENLRGKSDLGNFIWTVLVLKKWADLIKTESKN